MPEHIQAVIIILVLGMFVFFVSRKAFEPILEDGEFLLWRNTWAVITLMSFFAGSFDVFMWGSALMLFYVSRKIENKFAFFLVLLFASPAYEVYTSVIYISYPRMLSLAILLPMLTSKKWREGAPSLGKTLADKLLIVILILMFFLNMRGTTPGDAFRTSVTYFIYWLLPFYIASRAIKDFRQLKIALAALTIGFSIASLVGFFEYTKKWLLYQPIPSVLQFETDSGGYLSRGDDLRALASLTHPLSLGFVLMVGIGIYLFLSTTIENKKIRLGYYIVLALGLFSTVSRGPWGATAFLVLAFTLTGKKVARKLMLFVLIGLTALAVLPSIPGGQKILNLMPFIGKSEQFNVAYRQQLIPKSIEILNRSPLFGVFDARLEPEMSDMVQGENIVDIVNSYLNIALAYGYVGLTLYLWFFILVIYRVRKSMKYIRDKSSEEHLCGRSLLASNLGLLVVLSSTSFDGIVTNFTFILAGISFSYSRIMINEARNRKAQQ